MREHETTRRDTLDLWLVQILSTGLTLPVLSMFAVRVLPPGISLRIEAAVPPTANLGIPFPPDVLLAADRQTGGLGVLAGVTLGLALLTLVVGCATAATLVHRAGIARRGEMGVRAAVGASRKDLRGLVIAPLARRLLLGAAAGTTLGFVLLALVRTTAPVALHLPAMPVSGLSLLAIVAPVAAAWYGARHDLRAVLKRFASPLTLQSSTRLAPLGLGGAYFGLLVGVLATVGTLAGSHSYADVAPQDWAEARDTLLFELEGTGGRPAIEAVQAIRAQDPEGPWHLVSAGALEGLGPAALELSECGCIWGLISSPYTRLRGQRHSVTPGAFADLGVPVVRGREFTDADGPGGEGVVMIDVDHLDRYPGVDPIGKLLRVSGQGMDAEWYRIVGIVDLPKPLDLATADRPIPGVYFSALQHPPSHSQLVTRGGESRGAAVVVASAGVAARPLGSLADRLAMWAGPLRWFGLLIAIVSVGAFVVGVYGVTTLTWLNVRSRTTEFGVRRAMGARSTHIRWLVRREVAEVAAVGAAVGSILGVGFTAGLADRFRAVNGLDPMMLAFVALALVAASLLASRRPSRRAVRVTPIQAIGDATAD